MSENVRNTALTDHLKEHGGATVMCPISTFRILSDSAKREVLQAPLYGFAVSAERSEYAKIPFSEVTDEAIMSAVETMPRDRQLGLWHNKEDDMVYIDESIVVDDFFKAIQLAEANNQKAIMNLETFDLIMVEVV